MKKPGTITKHDAKNIMCQLDQRDRDIFWISFETGLRIGDILKLQIYDVQHNPMTVYETKSKRSRLIGISDELHEHLKRKYKYRPSLWGGNGSNLLFLSRYGVKKAINRSTYYRRLRKASTVLKINFSAHSGRKLFAMNVFERTGSVPAVQEALHHKYITTTATYLDIDLEKLLAEYKKS